jgi:hypothetical protein
MWIANVSGSGVTVPSEHLSVSETAGQEPVELPTFRPMIPATDTPGFQVRGATMSLGVAGGWQRACGGLGGRCRDHVAASPFVDLSFELGWRSARLWLGAQSAPTYSYLLGYESSALPLGELEAGVMVGNRNVRAGVGAFGGFLAAGASARVEITPWTGHRGLAHGLDVRAQVLATQGAPAWQGVVAYTWTPWRRFGGALAEETP